MASELGGTKEHILELWSFRGKPKIGQHGKMVKRMLAYQMDSQAIGRIENESEVL